ncbi:SIR2 family protein [Lonsdalea quercina]|uniref:SIR2 family protein n=1 Tax=Lonsdalea quercina TaxID=71657 RepID=UPI0039759C32
MSTEFPCKASNIYDKNINFLFGSGASASYIPTLWLAKDTTYETLLTDKSCENVKDFILCSYYNNVIRNTFCIPSIAQREKYSRTLKDYNHFITELVSLLEKKGSHQIRRANIFTTNYDLFFENAADKTLTNQVFHFNDGALGFKNRRLSISNFHITAWHQGTHDMYKHELPTINLIKMHGSVSWNRDKDEQISVSYPLDTPKTFNLKCEKSIHDLVKTFNETNENISDYLDLSEDDINILEDFTAYYKSLAIVNPTKDKFSETVFQQHYYQSLRLLSYELEKPQTFLICFGFSFQDEHILEIIKRSLSNPTLKVFVFCYNLDSKNKISQTIKDPRITFIYPKQDDLNISFETLINRIFKSETGDWVTWEN